MRYLSLFSGGGLGDFGFEVAGLECVGFCEINDYCEKLLELRWPNVKKWKDVKALTGEEIKKECGEIDLIAGGAPCTPFSVAGKQRGSSDDRHLWPEMFRIINEVNPAFVLFENVPGITGVFQYYVQSDMEGKEFATREDAETALSGITERTGTNMLHLVVADLEGAGYEVRPLIFSSHSLGAWHKRDRVWVIAHRYDHKQEQSQCNHEGRQGPSESWECSGIGTSSGAEGGDTTEGSQELGGNSTILSPAMAKSSGKRCDNRRDIGGKRQVLYDENGDATEDKPEWKGRKRGSGEASKTGEHALMEDTGCTLRQGSIEYGEDGLEAKEQDANQPERPSKTCGQIIPNTNTEGLQRICKTGDIEGERAYNYQLASRCNPWRKFWESEPAVGRVALRSPNRVERLKLLGNCQTPCSTYVLGNLFLKIEEISKSVFN